MAVTCRGPDAAATPEGIALGSSLAAALKAPLQVVAFAKAWIAYRRDVALVYICNQPEWTIANNLIPQNDEQMLRNVFFHPMTNNVKWK